MRRKVVRIIRNTLILGVVSTTTNNHFGLNVATLEMSAFRTYNKKESEQRHNSSTSYQAAIPSYLLSTKGNSIPSMHVQNVTKEVNIFVQEGFYLCCDWHKFKINSLKKFPEKGNYHQLRQLLKDQRNDIFSQ